MKKSSFILFLLVLLSSSFLVYSQNDSNLVETRLNLIAVKVVKVYDGDGCRALFPDGKIRKLRFANIDAPELKNSYVGIDSTQPFAIASRDSLRKLILGKEILVDTLPLKNVWYSYDRLVVDPYLLGADSVLTSVSEYVVARGWAWSLNVKKTQRKNPMLLDSIIALQFEAQKRRFGLWGRNGRKYSPAWWRKNF